MTPARSRWRLRLAALVAAAATLGAPAAAVSASTGPRSAVGDTAILTADVASGVRADAPAGSGTDAVLRRLGECMDASGRGSLVLLFDQSKSLQKTDEHKARVPAAQSMVAQFAKFADSQGVRLDVLVAGFGVTYAADGSWQRLTENSATTIARRVGSVANVDNGWETDYWTALTGARNDLRAHAGGSSCQAVVMFTDGKYLLDGRTTPSLQRQYGTTKPYAPGVALTSDSAAQAAQKKGEASLCNDTHQGPVNALRSDGTYLIAVGLRSTAPEGASASDFNLLRGIATAKGGTKCGTPTSPQTGAFVEVDNVDDLLFDLSRIGQAATELSCESVETGRPTACRFVLDESIESATVLGSAKVAGVTFGLRAPDGSTKILGIPPLTDRSTPTLPVEKSTTLEGTPLQYQWRGDTAASLTLTRKAGRAWSGAWQLTFTVPKSLEKVAKPRAQLTVEGDLRPVWRNKDLTLTSGGKPALQFGIAHTDGSLVPPSGILGTAALSAVLRLPDGTERTILDAVPPRQLQRPVPVDLEGVGPGDAQMRLSLDVTTASTGTVPGTRLATQTAGVNTRISPPAGIELQKALSFPDITGVTPVGANLKLTGPACFWLKSAEPTLLPDGVSRFSATSSASAKSSCIDVPEGTTAELPLKGVPSQQGNGEAKGTLTVALVPKGSSTAIDTTVPYTATMEKTSDLGRKSLAFLVALLLGLGLPPAFLAVLRWATSRIPGGSGGLFAAAVPVHLSGAGVVTARDGGPLRLSADQLTLQPVPAAGTREVALTLGGITLRVSGGPNLLAPARTIASAADARPLVADTAPHQDRNGRAVLPLAVHNHWIAWRSGPEEATVVVLVAGTATTETYDRLSQSVTDRLPGLLGRLPAASPPSGTGHTSVGAGIDSPPRQNPAGSQPLDDW